MQSGKRKISDPKEEPKKIKVEDSTNLESSGISADIKSTAVTTVDFPSPTTYPLMLANLSNTAIRDLIPTTQETKNENPSIPLDIIVIENPPLQTLLAKYEVELVQPSIKEYAECAKIYYEDSIGVEKLFETLLKHTDLKTLLNTTNNISYYNIFLALRDIKSQRLVAGILFNSRGLMMALQTHEKLKNKHLGTLLLATVIQLFQQYSSQKKLQIDATEEGLPTYMKLGFDASSEDNGWIDGLMDVANKLAKKNSHSETNNNNETNTFSNNDDEDNDDELNNSSDENDNIDDDNNKTEENKKKWFAYSTNEKIKIGLAWLEKNDDTLLLKLDLTQPDSTKILDARIKELENPGYIAKSVANREISAIKSSLALEPLLISLKDYPLVHDLFNRYRIQLIRPTLKNLAELKKMDQDINLHPLINFDGDDAILAIRNSVSGQIVAFSAVNRKKNTSKFYLEQINSENNLFLSLLLVGIIASYKIDFDELFSFVSCLKVISREVDLFLSLGFDLNIPSEEKINQYIAKRYQSTWEKLSLEQKRSILNDILKSNKSLFVELTLDVSTLQNNLVFINKMQELTKNSNIPFQLTKFGHYQTGSVTSSTTVQNAPGLNQY